MSALVGTWPAAPAAPAWYGLELRTVPRSSGSRPVRPADRTAKGAKKRPRLPAELVGIAFRFNIWFRPVIEGWRAGTTVLLFPNALDDCLEQVRSGRRRVPLTLHHDGRPFASTKDGCLEVFRSGHKLHVRLRGTTHAGRAALRELDGWPSRALSVGLHLRHFVETVIDGKSYFMVSQASIYEIAVVSAGAVRGCRFLS
jgi:hypothetical protein